MPKSATFRLGSLQDRGYPWEEPTLCRYPTPGTFLPNATDLDIIVRGTLASALSMAGANPAIAESRQSRARHLRQEVRKLLLSSKWNMDLYGCTNENYCGGVHPEKPGGIGAKKVVDHMMLDGRGINLLPRHADNLSRMESLLSPTRTTDDEGEILPGVLGGHRPILWIIALDLNALARKNPVVRVLRSLEPPWLITRLGTEAHHAA